MICIPGLKRRREDFDKLDNVYKFILTNIHTMKNLIIILLLFTVDSALGQQRLNYTLKRQLDSVMVLDQEYRETLNFLSDPLKRDSVAKSLSLTVQQANKHYWGLQNNIDSMNVVFIEAVFKKYGYPGKTLVGEPTNEAAWNIVQHSQKIDKYIVIIKKAAENKELPFMLYAKMLDRALLNKGEEQIYGTQAVCRNLKNGSGIDCFIWPIKDAGLVNERRKKAGFLTTVEQNAAHLDIIYRAIKITDVK